MWPAPGRRARAHRRDRRRARHRTGPGGRQKILGGGLDGNAVRRRVQRASQSTQSRRYRRRHRRAPASIGAIAVNPDPAPRSSTRLPRLISGVSIRYRANACPPAHANAQNGGGTFISPSSSSVFCQIGKLSSARCSLISGTSGGDSSLVLARMKAAQSVGPYDSDLRSYQLPHNALLELQVHFRHHVRGIARQTLLRRFRQPRLAAIAKQHGDSAFARILDKPRNARCELGLIDKRPRAGSDQYRPAHHRGDLAYSSPRQRH